MLPFNKTAFGLDDEGKLCTLENSRRLIQPKPALPWYCLLLSCEPFRSCCRIYYTHCASVWLKGRVPTILRHGLFKGLFMTTHAHEDLFVLDIAIA